MTIEKGKGMSDQTLSGLFGVLKSIGKFVLLLIEWGFYSFLALLFPVCMGAAVIMTAQYPGELTDAQREVVTNEFMTRYIWHMLIISGFLGGLMQIDRMKRDRKAP